MKSSGRANDSSSANKKQQHSSTTAANLSGNQATIAAGGGTRSGASANPNLRLSPHSWNLINRGGIKSQPGSNMGNVNKGGSGKKTDSSENNSVTSNSQNNATKRLQNDTASSQQRRIINNAARPTDGTRNTRQVPNVPPIEKCFCGVEVSADHPGHEDHEFSGIRTNRNNVVLLSAEPEQMDAILVDIADYLDLSHKLLLCRTISSLSLKATYWQWKECVSELLDPDSILDICGIRRLERIFHDTFEGKTTQLFWQGIAERTCNAATLRHKPMREQDRVDFSDKFLPHTATLAFDCVFAVGPKVVSYRDENNHEFTRWRNFFVIHSLYTLHEIRHFLIDYLPKKVEIEGVCQTTVSLTSKLPRNYSWTVVREDPGNPEKKNAQISGVSFTPELQLWTRDVNESSFENFDSRSDLVTGAFFVTDCETENGMKPHVITLYNFWIRSYDETRAKDVIKSTLCPNFDSYTKEAGVNHILITYQSFIVMAYMNQFHTQGKLVVFRVTGMSESNPELVFLETATISPTVTLTAAWDKIAFKSLESPTEVTVMSIPNLELLRKVSLEPVLSSNQIRLCYNSTREVSLQTYGVLIANNTSQKELLSQTLKRFNSTTGALYQTPINCGLVVNVKISDLKATVASPLFLCDSVQLAIQKQEDLNGTIREDPTANSGAGAIMKETRPFSVASGAAFEGGGLGGTLFQRSLQHTLLNNCLVVLFNDNNGFRLIKLAY